jgi:hypothetical protein
MVHVAVGGARAVGEEDRERGDDRDREQNSGESRRDGGPRQAAAQPPADGCEQTPGRPRRC